MRERWNDGWTFAKLPFGSTYGQMIKAEKKAVLLPHDFLIGNTEDLYETCDGWYVKALKVPEAWADRRLYLVFDGVYMDADILLDGQVIRTHRYGYTAFRTELTKHAGPGDHEVCVHIRHRSPNSRWYSGAGIYRNVWLEILPAQHMVPDGFTVDTRREGKDWRLVFGAEVTGEGLLPEYRLTDGGRTLAEGRMTGPETSLLLRDVRPWSPDSPYLYRLTLCIPGQEESLHVGFRETRFDPDRGFFLNGEHMKLHGVCLHHDLGALGAAFHAPAAERQLRLMKEMGVNSVRTSHNPPAREFLDLCDRLGMLVADECYDMWELPKTAYDNARFFADTYPETVAEWVRRDRCHPSVILWSIGNEIYDMQASEKGQYWTKTLAQEVHRHDVRHAPVTFGSNYMPWEGAQKCADIIRLPGYNYAEKYYEAHHRQHPDWVIYGSETASLVSSRGIYHFPAEQEIMSDEDLQCSSLLNSNTSWGARDVRHMLAEDLRTEYSLGQFVWSGIDYIGEPTPYHTRSSYFGQMDTACFAKDGYYFYQAMWTDAPMLHIGISWDWNAGQMIDVPVMTNCARAELFVNGRSVGCRDVDRLDDIKCLPRWKIPFEAGELTVVGYDGQGREMARDTRKTPGEAHSLQGRMTAVGEMLFCSLSAADARNVPVPNANDRVCVRVLGPGVLLGLDNGDSTDRDGYKVSSRRLFGGQLLAMVGRTGPGTVTVEAESAGLLPARISSDAGEPGVFAADCETGDIREPAAVRRIDLKAMGETCLRPGHDSVTFEVRLLPPEAAGQPVDFRITNAQGVDLPCAEITRSGSRVTVTARGDGEMYLRASACNGYPHPRILSCMEISASGFGKAGLDPYGFIAGALSDVRLGDIGAGNEQGIAFARDGESCAGFTHVDFGPVGSDTLILPVFALDGSRYVIGLWDGIPGQGGVRITDLVYQKPSIWNVYQQETYRLPAVLKGEHTLCFSLDRKVHLKGFSFERQSRAYRNNPAAEADAVYGDSFALDGQAVKGIGNNVTLVFEHMTFDHPGKAKLMITGFTPLPGNDIHVRVRGKEGDEAVTLCRFACSEGPAEQAFPVLIPEQAEAVSFVFLPGSSFDFYGFRFEDGD